MKCKFIYLLLFYNLTVWSELVQYSTIVTGKAPPIISRHFVILLVRDGTLCKEYLFVDVVNHSSKAIIGCLRQLSGYLQDGNQLHVIISFSDRSKNIFPLVMLLQEM